VVTPAYANPSVTSGYQFHNGFNGIAFVSLNGPQCRFGNVFHEPTRLVVNSSLDQPQETKMQIESIASQLLHQLRTHRTESGTDQINKGNASPILALVNQSVSSNVKQSYFGQNPAFRPSFAYVARYKTEDVVAQKDVIENQDVFETRYIFEERAILETKVESSRDLSGIDSLSEAGIRKGARFSVTIGDGPKAKIKFEDARTISVKVNGSVEEFTFGSNDGSFRTGLLDALNSLGGVTASYTTDGRLNLVASDGASLKMANIRKAPLDKLGLTEGTTNAEVIGYQQVQIGTEQVKVGEQPVVVGTETVKVGTKQVVEGYDRKLTGLERSHLFDVKSLTANLEDADSVTSPTRYVQMLFSIIPTDSHSDSSLVSMNEAKSAYDETRSENHLLLEQSADEAWPLANKLPGWL